MINTLELSIGRNLPCTGIGNKKIEREGEKKRENTFSIENENIRILYFHLSVNIPWGNSKEEEIRSKS